MAVRSLRHTEGNPSFGESRLSRAAYALVCYNPALVYEVDGPK